ncbi:hypothetical protein [Chamaesiphon sp. GL140_3_metabinner_50]|uniref:hypothetical protein n=1 Tax=Chamaesiphon sp. GL140_3_metabinner_50 TaxID=2970812 RepID=UPI0025D4E3CB|nr:hypothetical protein [Chamaesiphon sp. GL140_3_metabinner_50]
MISSQEFHQKLQAGKIHEALTLVMQSAIELDITTRITEDLEQNQSEGGEYLRTKIDLLTGTVENEVSKNLLTDNLNYLKLQQLHLDRINNTHQIVRDCLHQIRAILTVLPPSAIENMSIPSDTQSDPTNLAHPFLAIPDDDLDLSVERDGDVWEEWVEDEEFMPGVGIPQPPAASPMLTLPDRAQHSPLPRQFYPIEVKPIASRSTPTPVDAPSAWDKFAPEYIEISTEPPPRRTIDSNTNRHLNERLTNSDI